MIVLQELSHMRLEDQGEGNVKTIITNHKLLTSFVDWYNKWLFAKPEDKVLVESKELPIIHGLLYYGEKVKTEGKKEVTVILTDIKNDSMKDLGYIININDADTLAEKGLVQEKFQQMPAK